MFKKVLIANRGEIALRIIYACRELDIRTVAVYSEPDEHALHVRFADEEVCIGPARSIDSYLNVEAIIAAAEVTGADAIHPGYGFLSESGHLAETAEACRIAFIGPPPKVLRLMGNKAEARRAMQRAGLPVLPGTEDPPESLEVALRAARKLGYPLIVKASAGGGGRGLRIARSQEELEKVWSTARHEAEASFGDDAVYLERYIESPRHIEFQILADNEGQVVHLGERECSIQRRHQKLVEECPSTVLTQRMRRKLGRLVVDAVRAVNYQNAGTFEFLMEGDSSFYFLEANARLQVEHPVTEMVTGVDIVKKQIQIAAGEKLGMRQKDIEWNGHAVECRINAENPETFRPSPGVIKVFNVPGGPGIRVDTSAHTDCIVPPFYDSLVAKLIAHGRDRTEAIARMRRALEMTVIEGIETSVTLHQRIMDDQDFLSGNINTGFMDRFIK